MDERFALTRPVATKIIEHLDVKECVNGRSGSCWFIHQVNNALVLFPTILDAPKCREKIYEMTLSIARKLKNVNPSIDQSVDQSVDQLIDQSTNQSTKPVKQESELWHAYSVEFIRTVASLLSQFSPGQQRVLSQSIESVQSTSQSISQQEVHNEALDKARQLFFSHDDALPTKLVKVELNKTLIPINQLPRSRCPTCQVSNQPFYCTNCFQVLHPVARSVVPHVTLPFELHIIVHSDYDISKSTAFHTRLLCDPNQVYIHTWPTIPQFDNDSVLLFPSEASISVEKAYTAMKSNNQSIKRFVMIEATWPQAAHILSHSNLTKLMHIQLNVGSTRFWRHQSISPSYLSSIETIHAFTSQWCAAAGNDTRQYDDLLWLFALGWQRVRAYYKERPMLLVPPPSCD